MEDFKRAKIVLGKNHVEISPLISSSVSELPTASEVNPFYEIDYIFKNENISKMEEKTYIFKKVIPVELQDGQKEYVSRADMWHNRANSFNGCVCYVSKERCIIDYDGNVYKCFNEMFSEIAKPIMNINSKNFNSSNYFKDIKSMICTYNKCFFELEHRKEVKDD